jgi:putative sigma-54 modulation protein
VQFYDDIIGVEVFLKLEKTQSSENKITEIRIDIPGNELFAKKQSKSFEESTDNAIDALKKQITKHKEKIRRL